MYALAGPAHRDKREERNEGVKSGGRKSGLQGGEGGGGRQGVVYERTRARETERGEKSRVLPRANDIVTITVTTYPGAE